MVYVDIVARWRTKSVTLFVYKNATTFEVHSYFYRTLMVDFLKLRTRLTNVI